MAFRFRSCVELRRATRRLATNRHRRSGSASHPPAVRVRRHARGRRAEDRGNHGGGGRPAVAREPERRCGAALVRRGPGPQAPGPRALASRAAHKPRARCSRGSRATDLPCPPWPYSPAWSCWVAWGSAGCLSPRAVVWIESRARPCRQGFVARVNRDPRARGRPPGGARSALGSEGDLGAGDGGRKVGVPRLPHARRRESSKWT